MNPGFTLLASLATLKIENCMHPLPEIERCICTRPTCSNKGPVIAIELLVKNTINPTSHVKKIRLFETTHLKVQ